MPEIDDPEDVQLCEVLMDAYADTLQLDGRRGT